MRLAVCSWSLQPTDPEDLVQKVRACGLDRVQLALSPVVRAPDVWGLVFEVLQDGDIAVESGMMETVGRTIPRSNRSPKPEAFAPDEHWIANLEHAQAVAARRATTIWNWSRSTRASCRMKQEDPERAKLLDRLREVADVFAKHRVKLGLETGQESARLWPVCSPNWITPMWA